MRRYNQFRASTESYYVDDTYYDRLVKDRELTRTSGPSVDQKVRQEAEAFLFHEARLIDDARFDEWLDLFAEECTYWIPADDFADPREKVNITLDDRRRLEDRVIRLTTGHAHNQMPHRYLHHQVSNVEAWETGTNVRRVLSRQIVFEYRSQHPLVTHICKTDHRLIFERDCWRIAEKRIVLINGMDGLETPTLL